MASKLYINEWGATNEALKAANVLQGMLSETFDGIDTIEDLHNPNKGKVSQVIVQDKVIDLYDGDFAGFSVWVEDENDAMIQIYPPHGRMYFEDVAFAFGRAADKVALKVLQPSCDVRAEAYLAERPGVCDGHYHYLVADPTKRRRGMDLLEIRCLSLAKKPLYQRVLRDYIVELEYALRTGQIPE